MHNAVRSTALLTAEVMVKFIWNRMKRCINFSNVCMNCNSFDDFGMNVKRKIRTVRHHSYGFM